MLSAGVEFSTIVMEMGQAGEGEVASGGEGRGVSWETMPKMAFFVMPWAKGCAHLCMEPPRSTLQQTDPFGWRAWLHKPRRGSGGGVWRVRYVAPATVCAAAAACCPVRCVAFVGILSALYCNLQYFRFYFLMPRQGRAGPAARGGQPGRGKVEPGTEGRTRWPATSMGL